MIMENPYRPIKTEVIEVITETPNIKTLRLKPEERIDFVAGQFIELTVPGVGEAPFTPSSNPLVKDIMEVTIMKVGKVTEKIHPAAAADNTRSKGIVEPEMGIGNKENAHHTHASIPSSALRSIRVRPFNRTTHQ